MKQSNFNDYRVADQRDASDPGAKHRSARRISEPGAAPALTNPIFVATGKWIRELSIKD
jgi:CO/xanthine dehydrogenase Mo-binding subunit